MIAPVMRAALLVLAAVIGAGCALAPSPETASGPEYHEPPQNKFEEAFAHEDGVLPIRWHGWIKMLNPGAGANPTPDSVVKVNYRGTLTDGTEFDSSYKRGEPATFSLRDVISCWTFGVPMIKKGGKSKLVCPASAAYGERGSPPSIPGGATLVFEIELLDIMR